MLSWMSNRDEFRYTAEFIKEAFGESPNIEDVITAIDDRVKSL